jgi:hypothetical protein
VELIAEKRALRAAKASAASPPSPPTPDVFAKVTTALCAMGFPKRAVVPVMAQLRGETAPLEFAPLIRAALALLTPASG